MSTKSKRRAARRHPELADPTIAGAVGASILSLVTLGAVDGERGVVRNPFTEPRDPGGERERHGRESDACEPRA